MVKGRTDKDKVIKAQEELVASLKTQLVDKDRQIAWLAQSCDTLADEVRRWEAWKASSELRHARGREKTKNPSKPNKQKVGFLKKHKPKK